MVSVHHRLPATASQTEVEDLIAGLNADDSVDGILLQLPLPKGLDADAAIERIAHESEELRQLFADLAPLVAVQTPAVETIAMAAQRAADRTKLGLDELRKAEEEQAKGCAVQ